MNAERAELITALLLMAELAGDYDARHEFSPWGTGLRALHRLHDAIWDGQPYETARADETTELIDGYWRGHRAAGGVGEMVG